MVTARQHRELARTTYRIVSWGEDAAGEIYLVDFTGGGLHQLVPNDQRDDSARFPRKLSQTGLFASTKDHTPAPGLIPYSVNSQLWSDHAIKTRWFSVPNTNRTIGFSRDGNWSFPAGSVWVKHFELELTNGLPASRKRLETRFIVLNAGGVYGATYRWGDSLTNATLVAEEGMNEEFVIRDGHFVGRRGSGKFQERQLNWR